eukprot:6165109-Amphidinium_carterae.3
MQAAHVKTKPCEVMMPSPSAMQLSLIDVLCNNSASAASAQKPPGFLLRWHARVVRWAKRMRYVDIVQNRLASLAVRTALDYATRKKPITRSFPT